MKKRIAYVLISMMLGRVVFFLFLIFSVLWVCGQEAPVVTTLSWTQAGMKAIDEKKLVFVAVGISPVDVNARKLFDNTGVSLFLDRNTVGIAMDMESQEGEDFRSKLLMYEWPVYAYFMPFGDLLVIIKPEDAYKEPSMLIDAGREAMRMAAVKKENSRSILFSEKDLSSALELSRVEHRPIFLYGYRESSQSTLLMEKNVFNLDRVADFYNKHFICVKTNSIQSEQYPVYRFLNETGKVIYETGGYMDTDDFIGLGESVLERLKGVGFMVYDECRFGESGKSLFMDCYELNRSDRIIPDRKIYRDPEVAAYFNTHFTNTRLNLNSEEGKMFRRNLPCEQVPFVVFADVSGVVRHWVIRELDADGLLSEAKRFELGRGVISLRELYMKGEREGCFIDECLEVLGNAGLYEEAEGMVLDVFEREGVELTKDKKYWELFSKYVRDVDSEVVKYVMDHRAEYEKLYGRRKVTEKLQEVWKEGAKVYVKKVDGVYTFDSKGLGEYQKRLKKEKVTDWKGIIRDAKMYAAEKTEDWKAYADIAEQKWSEGGVSEGELYSWGAKINEKSKNASVRYKAARWFVIELDRIEQREKNTGRVVHTVYKGYYRQLIDALI